MALPKLIYVVLAEKGKYGIALIGYTVSYIHDYPLPLSAKESGFFFCIIHFSLNKCDKTVRHLNILLTYFRQLNEYAVTSLVNATS